MAIMTFEKTLKHFKDKGSIESNNQPTMRELSNGSREWHLNGLLHREDGPAVEAINGSKFWYLNGKLHREDGPAVEHANSDRHWYFNGRLHREDGPAIELAGSVVREWWLGGEELSFQEFFDRASPETRERLVFYLLDNPDRFLSEIS